MSVANGFLPMTIEEVQQLGIEQLDFVYVTGDAYVDHPSFGHAIITRLLQAHGYHVGIIAQPDWKNEDSIAVLGTPRLGFLVSSGNMDSMVNHYYVSKKHRDSDAYTPGGAPYKRPDHATVVYSNLIRRKFKNIPIIIGGIEASLRRMAHYDYWSNSFKRSILLDSQADLISYGMGEKSIIEIADALNSGIAVKDLSFIAGTVYKTKDISSLYDYELLPSYDAMTAEKSNMPKVSKYSTTTQTRSMERHWLNRILMVSMSFRIYRKSRFPCRRWMTSMHCRIKEHIIHATKRRAVCRRFQR